MDYGPENDPVLDSVQVRLIKGLLNMPDGANLTADTLIEILDSNYEDYSNLCDKETPIFLNYDEHKTLKEACNKTRDTNLINRNEDYNIVWFKKYKELVELTPEILEHITITYDPTKNYRVEFINYLTYEVNDDSELMLFGENYSDARLYTLSKNYFYLDDPHVVSNVIYGILNAGNDAPRTIELLNTYEKNIDFIVNTLIEVYDSNDVIEVDNPDYDIPAIDFITLPLDEAKRYGLTDLLLEIRNHNLINNNYPDIMNYIDYLLVQ